MSPGKESFNLSHILLTQMSHADYEDLCCLDVLGLSDTPTNYQSSIYPEFKRQLLHDKEGWYERRGVHPRLPNNKELSPRQLLSLNTIEADEIKSMLK